MKYLQMILFCAIFVSGYWDNLMQIVSKISGENTALCSGPATDSSRKIASVLSHRPDIGLYNLFLPSCDFIDREPEMYRVNNLETINKSCQRLTLCEQVADK